MKRPFILALESLLREYAITYRELPNYVEVLLDKDSDCVRTPCPIVYLIGGKLEEKQYLDLDLKDFVWGIKAGGLYWCKEETSLLGEKEVDEVLKSNSLKNLDLMCPSKVYFRKTFNQKNEFSKTVEILNAHNIEATAWNEEHYWTGIESHVIGRLSYSMIADCMCIEDDGRRLKTRFAIIP